MREMARYGFILSLICVVAAGLLAGVNSLTKARIISQAQAEEEAGLKEVLPGGEKFEAVKKDGDTLYYKAYDRQGRLVGVAFKASGKGYSSVVETLVGMSAGGKINAIKVLAQNETPGLGTRIAQSSFTSQFSQRNIKELAGVQAITGATISSKAVINSVMAKAEEVQRLMRDER